MTELETVKYEINEEALAQAERKRRKWMQSVLKRFKAQAKAQGIKGNPVTMERLEAALILMSSEKMQKWDLETFIQYCLEQGFIKRVQKNE